MTQCDDLMLTTAMSIVPDISSLTPAAHDANAHYLASPHPAVFPAPLVDPVSPVDSKQTSLLTIDTDALKDHR